MNGATQTQISSECFAGYILYNLVYCVNEDYM